MGFPFKNKPYIHTAYIGFLYLHFRYPKCLVTNFGATSFLKKISPLKTQGWHQQYITGGTRELGSKLFYTVELEKPPIFNQIDVWWKRPFLNVMIWSHPTETYWKWLFRVQYQENYHTPTVVKSPYPPFWELWPRNCPEPCCMALLAMACKAPAELLWPHAEI